jgi:hypothetical protein
MNGIGKTEQPKLKNPLCSSSIQNGSPKYHKKKKQIKKELWR